VTTTAPSAAVGPDIDGTGEGLALAALDLARRFSTGATLWCVSDRWPVHAHHLAVEFVHPVIVGARALPAVAVDGSGAARSLRLASRPGDVVVVVGPADDPVADDLVARAEAWGVTSIRLGAGARPSGRADHTVWLEEADSVRAARDGRLVVLYHLLWELTHVAFEHPGLLTPEPACTDEHCVTCSDEGVVAEVRSVRDRRATVVAGGHVEEIDVSLVGPLVPDQLVLVHAGVALAGLGGGAP
jgi:hypothetical protein